MQEDKGIGKERLNKWLEKDNLV